MTNTAPQKLVYLATPYSHPNKQVQAARFRAVNRTAAHLMLHGEHVFSPISHCHPIAAAGGLPGDWEFWEAYDRAILASCRKLLVLRLSGWDASVGVQAEMRIAQEMGIPVEFIDPVDATNEE